MPAGQGERGLGLVDHAVVVHVVRPRPGVRVLGQVLVAAGEGGRRRVLPRGKVVVLVGAWPRVVVAGGDRMPPREGKCRGLLLSHCIANCICPGARNILFVNSLGSARKRKRW